MSYSLFDPPDPFEAVISRLEEHERQRRRVNALSSDALRASKKAIFALQRRNDVDGALELLREAGSVLIELEREFGGALVRARFGPWRVAMEEFLEALFFLRFFQGESLAGLRDELLRYGSDEGPRWLECADGEVLGALSDLTGEIARQAQQWILESRYEDAIRANRAIAEAVELLSQNNSGGDLRRKVEQAFRNLHHSDARLTDLKIRGLI